MNRIGENTFNMNIHGYSNYKYWYVIYRNKISCMMVTLGSVQPYLCCIFNLNTTYKGLYTVD